MNKTKVTTRKGSKAKTKKESPEVFVLPPNLLEKLGINLGQYGSTSGNTMESQITDVNLNSQDGRPCINKPALNKDPITHVPKSSETESSSIIETAELMKKSVFLSPTFISNSTSIIQGEIEIVGNVAAEGVVHNAMNNEHSAEKTKDVSKDMQIESEYTVPNLISSPFSSSTHENNQCDSIANGNVETHELQMQTLIDDHADEAYSSDCSNSNIVCSVKSDTNKCNGNKINIISEKIIRPTDFYKFKSSFSPNESSLINVPISTIVIGQNKNSNEQVDSNVEFDPVVAETVTPADVAIVNERDMYEQNSIKEDDVIIENMELLQTISKIDICAVLNVSESELVINTQNKTDFPQDLEGFQMQHMQGMIIKDQATLDHVNVVPCHIDFVEVNNITAREKGDISADTKICLEDNDNTVKEHAEVNESPSVKKQLDDINITKTMSNEDTSHMFVDRNNLISCSKEAKNYFEKPVADQYHMENKCSPANKYPNIEIFEIKEKMDTQENESSEEFKSLQKCVVDQNQMEIDSQSKCSPANKYPNTEVFDVKEEMNTPENDFSEEFRSLQNGEADLVSRNNDTFATHNQQSLQSVTKNVSRTVNKYERRSRSIQKKSDENKTNSPISNLCTEYKNIAVEETSKKSPILYIKHYKKQVCEKYECQHEKKEDHENSELKVDPKNNSVSHEDKVREIAKYLSEFADLKKRKDFIQTINVSSKTLTNKKKRTDSKSSIQGVEKPGGSKINKSNLNYPPTKTYERRGRQECNSISSCQLKELKISTKAIDIVDSESANDICNEIEVCLCSDFGQLMSYDDVSSYEHIHFWNNARTECTTPDVIFSIYSEEAPVLDIDRYIQSDIEEYPSKISDVVPYKLCWNEINHMSDIKFDNSGTRNKISSSVDGVEKKTKENNKQQEFERKNVLESTMITVNSLENCEGVASNENHPDEPAVQTGQKREYSAVGVDNGEPPAKKKKKETSKQLPVNSSPLKTPSSLLVKSTPPVETGEHQTQALIPDNENPVSPSKTIHKAEKTDLLSTEKENETIICGVCQTSVEDWIKHIALKHDYLAWKSGEPSLDVEDEVAVREHLNEITKLSGGLTCSKCGLARKYVKAYLSHVRRCRSEEKADSSSNVGTGEKPPECVINEDLPVDDGLVQCGVCNESMHDADWNEHKATQHAYLAWKKGEPVLDVNDETAVREHLYEIAKTRGELVCAKCGLTRKTVRAYLSHTRRCAGLSKSQNDSAYNVSSEAIPEKESDLPRKAVDENLSNANAGSITCGVCEASVREQDWYHHIGSRHEYLAWKRGNVDLDVNDEEAVRSHLYEISKACGGLKCAKCGLTRKYVKAYLSHIKSCGGLNDSQNDSTYNASTISSDEVKLAEISSDEVKLADTGVVNKDIVANDGSVICAVCEETMPNKDWYCHASRHDYLAWKSGDTALDVTDDAAVKDHLYEITKACGGLTCSKCGLTRKYVKAYLTHIKTCDGLNKSQNDSSCTIKTEVVTESELVEPTNNTTNVRKQEDAQIKNARVKCGICEETVLEEDWYSHISSRHDYLAWKFGETALDINDETAVKEHLYKISSACGGLTCSKCGLTRKQVKAYLAHVKSCNEINQEDKTNEDSEEQTIEKASSFKCGVCNEVVISSHWEKHLSDNHEYLAWKDGDTPLNMNDEDEVHEHLYKFTKEFGCLHCKYCGKNRKYVKSFLEHIKACKNGGVSVVVRASTSLDFDETVDFASGGTCAVCHKEVEPTKWIQHTQKEHNYIAWREGERPWNLDDFEDINQYLYVICKRMDGLTCKKCGLVRKYVKSYLTHIKNCDVSEFDAGVTDGVGPSNTDEHQCAMCKELVKMQDWKTHAIEKHYNVTWIVGETPIDIKNVYAVERFLKEYKRVTGNLKCKACGTTRSSFAGFYAHIIICKKTEQEIDMYRLMCDICNNKYLCIYKNQHALMHRVQVITAENKNKTETEVNLSGKRRAAVKARTVIENYSDSISKHAHSCSSCGFGTDFEEELRTHKCEVSNEKDFSGDEDSAAEISEGSSEGESGDTDVDSNISNENNDELCDEDDDDDETQTKKKRYRDPAPVISKVSRIPFKVGDVNLYIRKGDEEFCEMNLTDEVLFPGWQCRHEPVLESELMRYLPTLERSCKLRSGSNWTILNRFEAQSESYGPCLFAGASISCIAWVPPRVQDIFEGGCNFLAIACHNGSDCPRYLGGDTPKHENLIQIWSFGRFRELPELVLGIAHDFGTVWSIAWCPSGARDAAPAKDAAPTRLGLLAVACSSGSAYIFAVPYPSSVVKDNQVIHKLKPVAELRMTMSSERKTYQATSVSWSKQREHKTILVGYADGSTAYYDLHSDSPLLSTVENDFQVIYPYYDERPLSTCITGTDLYPVVGDAFGSDVGAWTAPTGAELAARAGSGAPGRMRLSIASSGVAFAPQACSAVLAGDDAIMQASISELVWVPPGRRLGGTRCTTGCARCGRVACSMPPTLRLMRLHPSYSDCKKQVIAMIEMTHLAKKTKKVNDELSMIIEPLTYDEAVNKYGIEFTKISRTDRPMQQQYAARPKTHCPERFPLADVESMAFCPSKRFHDKLAVATHSGILFLTNTS